MLLLGFEPHANSGGGDRHFHALVLDGLFVGDAGKRTYDPIGC
jgi:hypothetical protein